MRLRKQHLQQPETLPQDQGLTQNSTTPQSQSLNQEQSQESSSPLNHMSPYIMVGTMMALVIGIIILAFCMYRRYRTRKLYEQTPENFSARPKLHWMENYRYENSQIEVLTSPQGQKIVKKEGYEGRYVELTFETHNNCLYYHHSLVSDCYFEIEFIKINSTVQIGFVHKDDIDKLCKKVEGGYHINFDQYGISVKTDGSVMLYGLNLNTFRWTLKYGDVIGIGMTNHDSSRRVWVTKNGVLMNPSTEQEMLREVKLQKDTVEAQSMARKKQDEKKEQEEKERREKLAAKQRIELKTGKKFNYYAVIVSEANQESTEPTVVNWNVGAHTFRLFDGNEMKGLLKK